MAVHLHIFPYLSVKYNTMNNILKVGLIYAAFSIVVTFAISVIDKSLLFKGSITWGMLFVGIAILVFAGRKYFRNEEEGILSYGEAVKKLLLACIIGFTVAQLFSTARFSNDTEMKTLFNEYTIEVTESMMRMTMGMTGMDEVEIEDQISQAKEEIEKREAESSSYPFSWSKLPLTLVMSIVYSLIFALIAAIFVREKETA